MHVARHFVQLSRLIGRKYTTEPCHRMCTNSNSIENAETNVPAKVTNSDFEIDWNKELDDENSENNRSILAPVKDEFSITAEPMLRPSYNLAAYVQKSDTLQQFLKLGVDLNKWDRQNVGQFIANLDFKRDVQDYIILLTKDIGVPVEELGKMFTKNPHILKQHLDDIEIRCNYLRLKRFQPEQIVSILVRHPFWLNYSIRDIDKRLGFFQKHFGLTGNQVRTMTIIGPKLVTHDLQAVQEVSFSVRMECEFTDVQVKQLVLKCPNIWMMDRLHFMNCYDFVTEQMKIENSQLVITPHILTNRLHRIKERHGYLKMVKRAQYNPKLPLYISLDLLCHRSDKEFAEEVAKTTYARYDKYLRSL